MVKVIQQIAEKIDRKLQTPKVLLLPGDCFFSQSFLLPEGIERKDIRQFAELSLEGISPFPLANLCWGYLSHPSSPHVIVYASYLERLRDQGYEDLDQFHQVFPGFITRFGQTYERATISFLFENGSLSALFYQQNNPVPEKIISHPLGEERPDSSALLDIRELLIKTEETSGYIPEEGVWVGIDHRIGAEGMVQFRHRPEGGNDRSDASSQFSPPALDERSVWNVDVRSHVFSRQTFRARRTSRRLWQGAVAAMIAAAILLVAETSTFATNIWTHSREKQIEARAEEALRIESRFDLLQKIDQFAQRGIKLFEMLDILNSRRPASVHFTRTSSDTYNHVTVQGLGTNVEEVNRYGEQLLSLPIIADANIQVVSRRGKAPFSMRVSFQELPASPSQTVAGVPPDQNR